MAKAKPTCDCVKQANKALANRNTQISLATMIERGTGRMFDAMQVPTEKVDSKKRGRPIRVQANFCPFCGVKYLPMVGLT